MSKIKKHQIPKIIETLKSDNKTEFDKNDTSYLLTDSKLTLESPSEMGLVPNRFKQKYCKKYYIKSQNSKYFI